jgi:hypothetical protein
MLEVSIQRMLFWAAKAVRVKAKPLYLRIVCVYNFAPYRKSIVAPGWQGLGTVAAAINFL